VQIDESGGDHVPTSIELGLAVQVRADCLDALVLHRDVGADPGATGAVDHGPAPDHEIAPITVLRGRAADG
jgi:hypothetical protein